MGTKNKPGKFDCYAAADPDEPLFILRANDEIAPIIIGLWAALRGHSFDQIRALLTEGTNIALMLPPISGEKLIEALNCGNDMMKWKFAQLEAKNTTKQ